jgi:malate dehydrogenase (oxaloacetate-decarboxylating)(NADP+)
MATLNKRPIIFPLSNPVSLCEVDFPDAVEWYVVLTRIALFDNFNSFLNRTDGKVIFASGSPYKPYQYKGRTYEPGQGNNMYIFPGIGLGSILSKSRHVSDAMVEQASIALSSSLNDEETAAELVYPRLPRIRDISARIALDVIRKSQAEVRFISGVQATFTQKCLPQGLDEHRSLRGLTDPVILEYIHSKQWQPTPNSNSRL